MQRALLILATVLMALGSAPAGAQDAAAPPALSQQQIEAFAGAAVAMRRLHADLSAQVRAAGDGDDIARLQQRAMAEEVRIVEASGLTPDQYGAIVAAARRDPELRATIVDLMQEQAL
jgi:hypothetical protein